MIRLTVICAATALLLDEAGEVVKAAPRARKAQPATRSRGGRGRSQRSAVASEGGQARADAGLSESPTAREFSRGENRPGSWG